MTASERVLKWIEAYIEKTRRGIGDGLPGEYEIMKETGVGRSSVREALTALKVLGIIRTRPKGGIQIVRDPVMLEFRHYFAHQYEDATLYEELMEFRAVMEWGLGSLAMVRIKDSTVQSLRRLLKEVEEQDADEEDIIHAEIKFHRILTTGCGNRLAELFVHLYEPVFCSRGQATAEALVQPNYVKQWSAEHKAILDALETRDWERFSKALKDHTQGYMRLPEGEDEGETHR